MSWSRDNTLRLWASGQQIGPAMKHDRSVRGAVLGIAFLRGIRRTGFMEYASGPPRQSALMLASWMTRAHLSDSAFRKVVSSAGVEPTGRAPCAARRACIPGDLMMRTISALILAASVGGKLGGAMTAYQSSAS